MLSVKLLDSFRNQFDRIQNEQLENIEKASTAIAESVMNGGAWRVHDTGHIIDSELIHRGGGLMFIRPFTWGFNVNDNVPKCIQNRPRDEEVGDITIETVRLAVKASSLRKGDVITIGSVSGRSTPQVELALECKRIGVTVVVISAYDYATQVESRHPSGKRLHECADIFIDNLAPLGDGHMEIEGYDVPLFPTSGLNAAVIAWMMVAGVVEKMMAAGKQPQIWKSANIDGGGERNEKIAREIVDEIGY